MLLEGLVSQLPELSKGIPMPGLCVHRRSLSVDPGSSRHIFLLVISPCNVTILESGPDHILAAFDYPRLFVSVLPAGRRLAFIDVFFARNRL